MPSTYVDDLKVKISEKYKPPPRIGLPITYSQRLTMNKHLEEIIPQYTFQSEKMIKNKLQNWAQTRQQMQKEREENLAKLRETMKRRQRLSSQEETHQQSHNEPITCTPTLFPSTSDMMLVPTQATPNTTTSILTPQPLTTKTNDSTQTNLKNITFNVSDFEADTSSPFDNMELKSINDMEELAQVLRKDDSTMVNAQPLTNNYNSVSNCGNYTTNMGGYSYNMPQSHNYAIQSMPSYFTNGCYYPLPSFGTIRDNSKSIPDLMVALETELSNTQIGDNHKNISTTTTTTTSSTNGKSNLVQQFKNVTKNEDETFNLLSEDLKDVCRSISSMGFPLSRIARVCKLLGNDRKKIIEHLLVMSELLDLGFPENKVSNALLESDNDRDKALDILIS